MQTVYTHADIAGVDLHAIIKQACAWHVRMDIETATSYVIQVSVQDVLARCPTLLHMSYSRTSMARTPVQPRKYVRDRGS